MKREVKIGIFAVAMIGAAWAGIRFLKGFDIFSTNNEYYAAYDQINGVQNASPIMMRGVKIGSVTGISFDPSRSEKVILHFTINRKYHIPTDSEAKIFSNGLMGAKAVEIIYGDSREYLNAGDTLRSGRDRDLMDVAGSELEFFKQKLSQVTADLTRTMDNLNALMERNADDLSGTIRNLNQLTGQVNTLLARERENLSRAVEGFSEFASTLGDNSDRVDSLLMNLNSLAGQLNESNVAANLGEAVGSLDSLLKRIETGDGTVSRLINDSKLYDSLSEASENLSLLLADLKKYPGRYVHLSLFGRNPEKMKAKADRQYAKQAVRAERDSLRNLNK